MKVGDLVQKTHLNGDPLPYKGIILSIHKGQSTFMGQSTFYKIKWFYSDIISDRWTELEFCLLKSG